jgi:hypothetical protein
MVRQQDCTAQGDVCEPVRRDAQRHEAQLVSDERVRAAHDEFPAPASSSAVLRNADMADLVGSHETTNAPGQPNGQSILVMQACWMALRMTSSPAG